MGDFVLQKIDISEHFLKLILEISKLEDRFANLPLKNNWGEEVIEETIKKSALYGFLLDTKFQCIIKNDDILSSVTGKNFVVVSNEIEVRKSFPLYFGAREIDIEILEYLHRFLDNIQDELSISRGRFRTRQDQVQEFDILSNLNKSISRYGFIKRDLNNLFKQIKNSGQNEYILSAQFMLNILKISPFLRANLRVARIIAKGFLFRRKIDINHFVSLEEKFFENRAKFYKILNSALISKEGENAWIRFYLQNLLKAYKQTVSNIEIASGGTIRPLNFEVISVTKKQKIIIELLKKYHQMSGSEIAKLLNVSRQNIFVIMQKLIKKGIVLRVGSGTASRYKLNIDNY